MSVSHIHPFSAPLLCIHVRSCWYSFLWVAIMGSVPLSFSLPPCYKLAKLYTIECEATRTVNVQTQKTQTSVCVRFTFTFFVLCDCSRIHHSLRLSEFRKVRVTWRTYYWGFHFGTGAKLFSSNWNIHTTHRNRHDGTIYLILVQSKKCIWKCNLTSKIKRMQNSFSVKV